MEENKQVVAEWKALNQPRLQEIKKANPELYSAVNLALQYLNTKLGGEELLQEVEEVETQTATTKQWTLDDFKNTKIIVDTPEKSRKFQELFLSLGGEWSRLDNPKLNTVANLDKIYLVISGPILLFFDSAKSFNSDNGKLIFYDDIFPSENESTESQSEIASSTERKFTWKSTIETYPTQLRYPSWAFNFERNNGNRKSPTQSAGELKRRANTLSNSVDAIQMILETKFKGNDGNWYIINVGKGGVWTWKETTPPPTQSTSFTSTASSQPVTKPVTNYKPEDLIGREIYHKGNYKIVKILKVNPKTVRYKISNSLKDIELDIPKTAIADLIEGKIVGKAFLKDYKPTQQNQTQSPSSTSEDSIALLSDSALKQLYTDTYEARQEFILIDPEYKELTDQIVAIGNEIDKRKI